MTPQQWQLLQELYHRLADGDDWRARLDDQVVDPDVYDPLADLLEARADAVDFLEVPVIEALSSDGSWLFPGDEDAEPRIPEELRHYRIEESIGRGGMGIVYLAEDTVLGRRVALKVLSERWSRDPTRLAGLVAEAKSLASLNHPNIATIHALEESDDRLFIAMEWIPGETLRERLTRKQPTVEEALDIARQIARALEVSHRSRIIHCDLKPGNIKVTHEGQVKVLDFGLARGLNVDPDTDDEIDEFTGVGTPGYMSPEQLTGRGVDHRTDIFAFGCVLYECLCGEATFAGDISDIVRRTLSEDPDWGHLPNDLPDTVKDLLKQCLQKDADERPASITDVRLEIEDVITRAAQPRSRIAEEPASRALHNLPHAVDRFVGRQREMARIVELLGEHRWVTLTGVGGGGKSRLALETARPVVAEHAGGVWLVELAPLSEAGGVGRAIVQALGLAEIPGTEPLDAVVRRLRGERALLILDNCEHLLDGCRPVVDGLLAGCPELRIVATSRESFGGPAEKLFHVPPLELPPEEISGLAELERYESSCLFMDRARSVAEVVDDDAAAVAAICRRLDGIPLAIELAAARVKTLSADEIFERLDDRFRLLTSGLNTKLPHHEALATLIDWSYQQLSDPERTLLRRLAVFAGGWTLEAAEAVCAEASGDGEAGGESVLEEWDVLDGLSGLVDKSLVSVEIESVRQRRRSRYRMLETVREYALKRLDEHSERERILDRHRRFFLSFAEKVASHAGTPTGHEWHEQLAFDHDNCRETLRPTASDTGIRDQFRIAVAMKDYWLVRGRWQEGAEIIEGLLVRKPADLAPELEARTLVTCAGLAVRAADFPRAGELLTRAEPLCRDGESRHLRAEYLRCRGSLKNLESDYDTARTCLEECLQLYEDLEDTPGKVLSLQQLGYEAMMRGDYHEARRLLEEGVELARARGSLNHYCGVIMGLATVLRYLGELEKASELSEEALAISEKLDNPGDAARCLNHLGILSKRRGGRERAIGYFERAIGLMREVGSRRETGYVILNCAALLSAVGDLRKASSLIEESIVYLRESKNTNGLGHAFLALANIDILNGEYERAIRHAERVKEMARSASLDDLLMHAHIRHGLAASCQEEFTEARRELGEAAGICERIDMQSEGRALVQHTLADTLFSEGRLDEAIVSGEEALAIRRSIGDHVALSMTLLLMANIRIEFGDLIGARALCNEGLAIHLEMENRVGLVTSTRTAAKLALEDGEFERAARLLGFADEVAEFTGQRSKPKNERLKEADLVSCRAALGDEALARAREEGRSLSMKQAVALALGNERS